MDMQRIDQNDKKEVISEKVETNVENKVEKIIEESRQYVYPEKMQKWKDCLIDMMDDYYSASVVTDIMEMMKHLENNENLSLAKEVLDKQNHSGMTETMLRNAILNFSKRGPEFYEYTASQELSPQEVEILKIIKNENLELEEKHKDEKNKTSDIASHHTLEEVVDGINPSMTEIDEVAKEMVEEQTKNRDKDSKIVE